MARGELVGSIHGAAGILLKANLALRPKVTSLPALGLAISPIKHPHALRP